MLGAARAFGVGFGSWWGKGATFMRHEIFFASRAVGTEVYPTNEGPQVGKALIAQGNIGK